jgi:DAK2 domain fusion protein YloV
MGVPVTAGLVRDWALRALTGLGEARAEIDALNVFPVPDGDTGTNLYLTMESAVEAVGACWQDGEPRLAEAARAMALGALMGARGNSGVIVSQILRGTSEVLAEQPDAVPLDPDALRRLLRRAADLAYEAVARPVEGTILTVARAAADAADAVSDAADAVSVAADAASERCDAADLMRAAAEGARAALDETPTLLESLRLAGVVDAGGRGLVVVLDALADVLAGAPAPEAGSHLPLPRPVDGGASHHYGGPAYEVMFLLDAPDEAIGPLRRQLDGLGDSLVVVGGDGLWNVHVHVDDAGAAVEAGMAAGRPYRLRITHLEAVTGHDIEGLRRGLVAVTHGPGVASLLRSAGVAIVPAAAGQRPSVKELLDAILLTHATEAVLLPSDSDTRIVAEAAAAQAREAGTRVAVIPTRSVVQTLAAAAVHDPSSPFDDDVVAMTRAAGATRYAAVTIASRAALTTVGPCAVGDVLGLVDGDIVIIGRHVADVAREILTGMLAIGGELVTFVWGEDADEAMMRELPAWVESRHPLVEVVAHDGGQPLWPVIMGVE